MGTIRKSSLRDEAIRLRTSGYSYGMILEELEDVSKSTLSCWLRDIPFQPNKELIARIGNARINSAKSKNSTKLANIAKARTESLNEVGELSERDLFMLGIAIYYGEGSKSNEDVRVVNSDPVLIKTIIKWFRVFCGLTVRNFAPRIHLYPDCDESKSKQYWSEMTDIPVNQFQKTQVDKRSYKSNKGKNRLPFGTLHLQIRSLGNPEHGRFLHRKIMGWIDASMKQI